MTVASGTGYVLIALGPAISLFITCIAAKPFLIITVLASTLTWLVTLIVVAAVWRGLLPGASTVWLYVPLLLSAVAFQEAVRIFFWHQYPKLEDILNRVAARISKPRIQIVDKIEIALAFGLGHGLAHSVFFCLSLLTPAFGPATFYMDRCPQMSLFLVSALTALAFLLIHTFSMIIAFNGHEDGKKGQQIFVPCMHLTAALLTLTALAPGGCVWSVATTLLCAVITLATCLKVVWEKTRPDSAPSGVGSGTQHLTTGL